MIGTDYYWSFVEDKIVRGEGPIAQQSKLGFLLSEPVSSQASQQNVFTMTITTSEGPNLEKFWLIEEAGTSPSKPEQSDTDFIHQYQTTCISQATDGTYSSRQSKEHASLNNCLLVGPPFLNDCVQFTVISNSHLCLCH